jgi:hypothetical protein
MYTVFSLFNLNINYIMIILYKTNLHNKIINMHNNSFNVYNKISIDDSINDSNSVSDLKVKNYVDLDYPKFRINQRFSSLYQISRTK